MMKQKRKEQTKEQRRTNKFVAECLQECLNTPITDNKPPRVLFMAEALNARKILNLLQNQNLLTNDPLQALKQYLSQEQVHASLLCAYELQILMKYQLLLLKILLGAELVEFTDGGVCVIRGSDCST
ncbi:MAG: RNaseH domain-containing protein [Nostoc sp.]